MLKSYAKEKCERNNPFVAKAKSYTVNIDTTIRFNLVIKLCEQRVCPKYLILPSQSLMLMVASGYFLIAKMAAALARPTLD